MGIINKKRIFFLLLLFPAGFLVYCFYPVVGYDVRYSQHVNVNPAESLAPGRIFLTDRNGEVITDKSYPNGYYKAISTSVDSQFVKDLLQIEDKNFYSHWGVNLPAKIRAIRDNFAKEKVSGGSTITEQYIKNKYFQNAKRSYPQKLREAVLAVFFDVVRSKEHILNMYYDDAYFGNQLYGVGAAIEVYFGKDRLEQLTQEERVLLISLIHNPGIESLEETYFQNYFQQVKERLGYSFERSYFGKLPHKNNIDRFPFVTLNYIARPVDQQMTIDAQLQEYAREVLQNTLSELKDKNVSNGAIFAMNPKTGEVLIYQGSKDFYAHDIHGQVDVIQSERQPGSTVKPFLYLLALRSGAQSDSILTDTENEYNSFQEGSVYVSENYSLREYGLVRLKKALGNSFNNATVRLARELGLQEVYDFYQSYGFDFTYGAEHYGYSLVLGNASMTLENLVMSYTKLLDFKNPEKFILYDILSDPDNRDVSFGVNSILNTSIPQAVKTGTSSDFRDNWVISYHPDLVVGVWVGNNDNSSMQGVTGITGAGYVWHQVIEKAIELGYISSFPKEIPDGVSQISYCLDTSCFRKENTYVIGEQEYFSRLAEKIYDSRDIYESFTNEEIQRLSELRFEIQ